MEDQRCGLGWPHGLCSSEGGGKEGPSEGGRRQTSEDREEEGPHTACRQTAPQGPRRVDAGRTSPGQQRPWWLLLLEAP